MFGELEKTSVVTFHFVWHFAFNISPFSTPASLRNGGGSWDLRNHNARDVATTPWWRFFGWIKSTAEDFDVYAKFDRLEQLRENLRNLTECLGYRSITLLWQSLTAAKIFFERHWIPKEVLLIVDHPYILVDLDGMNLSPPLRQLGFTRGYLLLLRRFFSNLIWMEDMWQEQTTKNFRIPELLPLCIKGNSVQNSVRPSRAFHLIALYPCHLSKCPKGWSPCEASTR